MKLITCDFTGIKPITSKDFGDGTHQLVGTLERYALNLPGNPDDIALIVGSQLYIHPELFTGIVSEHRACIRLIDGEIVLNFVDTKGELVETGSRKAKPLNIVLTSITPYLVLAQKVERYQNCMNPGCPKGRGRVLSFKQSALLIGWAFGREDEHLLCSECAKVEVKKDPSLHEAVFYGSDLPINSPINAIRPL